MNTQKVAITIPKELVAMVDDISKKRGLSQQFPPVTRQILLSVTKIEQYGIGSTQP